MFILLATSLLPPLLAGFVMAGILAATISSSDSYLLIAASAFSKNIYQGLFRKKASDKEVLRVSRLTLLLIAVVAIVIALDENSVIFTIVSFAWAGFGATFGPLMLFSLFWKRTTRAGAIAGCWAAPGWCSSGSCWCAPGRPVGCLRTACLPSCSRCSASWWSPPDAPPPSEEIQREFDEVNAGGKTA